jgi:hypothetical protein
MQQVAESGANMVHLSQKRVCIAAAETCLRALCDCEILSLVSVQEKSLDELLRVSGYGDWVGCVFSDTFH